MKIDNDAFVHRQMPVFIEKTQGLLDYLKELSYEELKSVWKCSDKLAKQNFDRIKDMDLYNNLTPAILSFEGLQYKYMAAGVFSYEELDYIEEHLRILSGFYGVLRPSDGIVPYRLEMKSKLLDSEYKSLHDFWQGKIAESVFFLSVCILNLASKEYSDSISKYLNGDVKFINCIFGEFIDGRVIEKSTLIKMARGEMVRFMAENNIKNIQGIKKFDRLDYHYRENLSDDKTYVFIKGES